MEEERVKTGPKQLVGSWFIAVGLLVSALGSAFVPWIWRDVVALQLTAPGLAEFVKFLPEVRTNQVQVNRLYFLAPLFVTMLALPLFAVNRQLVLPGWIRWLMRLVVVPLALAGLSPVWTPAILVAAEFRLQSFMAVLAIGLAMLAPLLAQVSLRILTMVWTAGVFIALILAWWQFSLIRAGVEGAYHEAIVLGPGWWLILAGVSITLPGAVTVVYLSGSNNEG